MARAHSRRTPRTCARTPPTARVELHTERGPAAMERWRNDAPPEEGDDDVPTASEVRTLEDQPGPRRRPARARARARRHDRLSVSVSASVFLPGRRRPTTTHERSHRRVFFFV